MQVEGETIVKPDQMNVLPKRGEIIDMKPSPEIPQIFENVDETIEKIDVDEKIIDSISTTSTPQKISSYDFWRISSSKFFLFAWIKYVKPKFSG